MGRNNNKNIFNPKCSRSLTTGGRNAIPIKPTSQSKQQGNLRQHFFYYRAQFGRIFAHRLKSTPHYVTETTSTVDCDLAHEN